MPRGYEILWPDCNVKHLVLSNEEFIVFIDPEDDLDWSTSDKYDEDGKGDEAARNGIINEAALLEATPCEGISSARKLQFKRLIGEALARSFDHDYAGAQKMLGAASRYILACNYEVSRRWLLSASIAIAGVAVAIGLVVWTLRVSAMAALGSGAFWAVITASAGAVGALLSVIERSGRMTLDCSSGRALHNLEAAARIITGSISGVVVGLAIRSELILSVLVHGSHMPIVMLIAAIAAGSGERLVSTIFTQVTTGVVKNAVSPETPPQ
jgi:hypothetical protein